jgi:iron complex transport system ATP-binding protein
MTSVVSIRDLGVVRDGRIILSIPELTIRSGERWALLGPNGSGKSTLLSVISGRLWPTSGEVEILGFRFGKVDLRMLRSRLGLLSASVSRQLRPALSAHDVVVTGVDGALEPWWRDYSEAEHGRADELLRDLGIGHLAQKQIGVISEGERAQVLLARVLIADPELLCLDEPAAGLDLGARERLLERLASLLASPVTSPVVLVTHHLEELPVGLTHAALLRGGEVVAHGEIDAVVTSTRISTAFDVDVEVTRHRDGRFSARGRSSR